MNYKKEAWVAAQAQKNLTTNYCFFHNLNLSMQEAL
jgi:hypothetical protein